MTTAMLRHKHHEIQLFGGPHDGARMRAHGDLPFDITLEHLDGQAVYRLGVLDHKPEVTRFGHVIYRYVKPSVESMNIDVT